MSQIKSYPKAEQRPFSHNADRFLRLREMLWRVGLSRSAVYRMINTGDFPKQIKLNKTTAVWSENAIIAWMDQQKAALDPDQSPQQGSAS